LNLFYYLCDMKKIQTKQINFDLLAQALGLNSKEQAFDFMNDGRIVGRLAEFWVDGIRQNENSSFDVENAQGERIEVRAITKKVSFASSKEVGFGRKVTDKGYIEKLNSLDKFVLADIRSLKEGKVDMIEVNKEQLATLPLGKNKSISAKKFFKKYDGIK
jgi:hypothetical protein